MTKPVLEGILPTLHQGKVRDTSSLPRHPGLRVIDATNRVSTHNVCHTSKIPDKGEILLALSLFWEQKLKMEFGIATHTHAFGPSIYDYIPRNQVPEDFHQHAIVAYDVEMMPWEFIFRARMLGSLWDDYYSQGLPNPYGLILPPGMRLMEKFPKIIFTPTNKSATDDPVESALVERAEPSAVRSMQGYFEWMRKYALERNIEILDMKCEAGFRNGRRTIADECGTPDCCRYVDAKSIIIGENPEWLDKQYLREEAMRLWEEAGGVKKPITFSDQAIQETRRRYHEIVERLTGMTLSELQRELCIA
jgi:phosphoribosylaminoimidazole-succinocarboxamide synthase